MDQMAERLGLPQQPITGDGVLVLKIPVAMAFPTLENGMKGGLFVHCRRHPPILPEGGEARKKTLKVGQPGGTGR